MNKSLRDYLTKLEFKVIILVKKILETKKYKSLKIMRLILLYFYISIQMIKLSIF
jgi:hypothetical protein